MDNRVYLVQFFQFKDEKILKPSTGKLKNLPHITHLATVVTVNRTRTQIFSILFTVLYWCLEIFVNLHFLILNFLHTRTSCTKLIQVRPIGEGLINTTKRNIFLRLYT